jgi:hypothetical protein
MAYVESPPPRDDRRGAGVVYTHALNGEHEYSNSRPKCKPNSYRRRPIVAALVRASLQQRGRPA